MRAAGAPLRPGPGPDGQGPARVPSVPALESRDLAMIDTFRSHSRTLTAPPEAAAAILPADTGELACATRAVYVGGGGDLRVRMLGGMVVTLAAVPGGSLLPLRIRQVLATGSTAHDLVGFW
jgi:hypothetical protein